jgi:uncharacterized alkaline shock family protein YloU
VKNEADSQTDYRIAVTVLEDIVRGALAGETCVSLHPGVRLSRDKTLAVSVSEGRCRVSLGVDGRLGDNLPGTGARVKARVAEHLECITGLTVDAVDVTFVSVTPADEPS